MEELKMARKLKETTESAIRAADDASFRAALLSQGGRQFLLHLPSKEDCKDPERMENDVADWLQEIAWEKLHTGNWKDVHVSWRDAYSLACLLAATAKMFNAETGSQPATAVADALRDLDMAAMMGGPRFRRQVDDIIALLSDPKEGNLRAAKKRRLDTPSCCDPQLPFGSFQAPGATLEAREAPSLEAFWERHMQAEEAVLISGAIEHWPARTKWQDLNYLARVAGNRTVPVEVGSHYLAEGWGQQLMPLSDFIRNYLTADIAGAPERALCMAENPAEGPYAERQGRSLQQALAAGRQSQAGNPRKGYLAQHPLFDQIPVLRSDIAEPMYCCLGEGEPQAVNAWFGPAGTVTPLHYDPHHNLLAQVIGRKYVRLYTPAATAKLSPFDQGHHTNSSQIDLDDPSPQQQQQLDTLPFKECIVEAGHMLYIPPLHWHYVKSLDVSFSVTFWWR